MPVDDLTAARKALAIPRSGKAVRQKATKAKSPKSTPVASAVWGLMMLVDDLPATRRKTKAGRVETRRGVVTIPPDLAKTLVTMPSALTRGIDAKHVSALRETMRAGDWMEDSSVIQIHVATKPEPHVFIVDGSHRLAAMAGLKDTPPVLLVLRQFETADNMADVAGYDAANSQKAQSLTARAKTIARRTAPAGWEEAEVHDKTSVRGAIRYGTLVQQGYRFGARAPARNLPMTRVMDAAFEAFPRVQALVRQIGTPANPASKLLASDAVLALLALADLEGLHVARFLTDALANGPVQRELAKVAGRKPGGGSGAIVEVQAVAAALLWKSGLSEGEALRAVYQDRQVEIGNRVVKF
jgi:hypothetical protein